MRNVRRFHHFSMREIDLFAGTAAAKHAAFVRARGRHYSNEAEAMKVSSCCQVFGLYLVETTQRAAKMADEEEEEGTEDSASALADGAEDVAVNGVHGK